MEKIDARTLNQDEQYLLRKMVIRLRQRGMTYREISDIAGINISHACKICKRYQRDGDKGIVKGRRGRRSGEKRTLDMEQEKAVQQIITDKTPDQLKFPFGLWTRQAVQMLIEQRWGIRMPIRTVGEYLHRWGFTPQKPKERAYEQNPIAVKRWLDEEYPSIVQRAKEEGAEIHWCDETGVRSDECAGRGYAPKECTPVIRLNAARKSVNMISAITNQGKVRFMVYKETMNAKLFVKFVERLIKDAGRKVFLVLDNLRVHHGKLVEKWLESHRELVEIFYLPSYSPKLNPDVYLNCELK